MFIYFFFAKANIFPKYEIENFVFENCCLIKNEEIFRIWNWKNVYFAKRHKNEKIIIKTWFLFFCKSKLCDHRTKAKGLIRVGGCAVDRNSLASSSLSDHLAPYFQSTIARYSWKHLFIQQSRFPLSLYRLLHYNEITRSWNLISFHARYLLFNRNA